MVSLPIQSKAITILLAVGTFLCLDARRDSLAKLVACNAMLLVVVAIVTAVMMFLSVIVIVLPVAAIAVAVCVGT